MLVEAGRGRDQSEDANLIEVNPLIVTADRDVVALDAKVTIDGNALFRHQDLAEIADTVDDPQEAMAKEKGLTYVKLDGNVGILANGAGLCMSTLDVVAQAGGAPANFLDAGGGSKAEAIVNALEVIVSDKKVSADPLQHLRRHHPLRRDRQGHRHRLQPARPRRAAGRPARRHQLRAGAGDPRRGRPAQPAPGEDDARRRAPRRRAGGGAPHEHHRRRETKLVVSGLTGREGSFHGLRNQAYGTDLVAGVTPGKGGQDVEGVPIFDTITEAVEEAGANTSMIFVPARFAAPAIDEAIESGVETVIAITEGIPVLDMLNTYWKAKEAGVRLIGPNCPGVLSPGKANVGIIPAQFFDPGSIGVVSKSGTLTYQIGNELKQAGAGNSSIVGIGGDPIVGSDFIDILTMYEADPETELIVMVGEIGGDAEERAAEFISVRGLQAGRRLHRRLHRAPGQADGPRRRDHLRLLGNGAGEERRARSQGRAGRREPDRGRGDRGRDPPWLLSATKRADQGAAGTGAARGGRGVRAAQRGAAGVRGRREWTAALIPCREL